MKDSVLYYVKTARDRALGFLGRRGVAHIVAALIVLALVAVGIWAFSSIDNLSMLVFAAVAIMIAFVVLVIAAAIYISIYEAVEKRLPETRKPKDDE